MKAILEFNLPEENEDHYLALNGWKYKVVIEDFFNFLRTKSKYEDVESLPIDEIRAELVRLMTEREVE